MKKNENFTLAPYSDASQTVPHSKRYGGGGVGTRSACIGSQCIGGLLLHYAEKQVGTFRRENLDTRWV
jgi:hypothetical protein